MQKSLLFSVILLAGAFSVHAQTGARAARAATADEQALKDRYSTKPARAQNNANYTDAGQVERDKRVYTGGNKAGKPAYTAPDNQYNRNPNDQSTPTQYNTGRTRAN